MKPILIRTFLVFVLQDHCRSHVYSLFSFAHADSKLSQRVSLCAALVFERVRCVTTAKLMISLVVLLLGTASHAVADESSPLVQAIKAGNVYLVAKHANPDTVNARVLTRQGVVTPLLLVVSQIQQDASVNVSMLKILLAQGADPKLSANINGHSVAPIDYLEWSFSFFVRRALEDAALAPFKEMLSMLEATGVKSTKEGAAKVDELFADYYIERKKREMERDPYGVSTAETLWLW